jgi:hypothetical protein
MGGMIEQEEGGRQEHRTQEYKNTGINKLN